jgi:hypothetical protein
MMATTPFSREAFEFSQTAHHIATTKIYPNYFGACEIEDVGWDNLMGGDSTAHTLDADMKIDVRIRVRRPNLAAPLTLTAQERFRRPDAFSYQDVTFAYWNNNSGRMGELFSLQAQYFVYAVLNPVTGIFLRWHIVDVPRTLLTIADDKIAYTLRRNPRSGQTFLALALDDLRQRGLVLMEKAG